MTISLPQNMTRTNCSTNFCQNNGHCYTNTNNNSWWCVCFPCTTGPTCAFKNSIITKNPPDVIKLLNENSSINYQLLIIVCISLMVSIGLLNNVLALSTFIHSESIRLSYKGIYLISYSVCSIYVMIYVEIRYIITLYAPKSVLQSYSYQYIYNCYVGIIVNTILIAAPLWFSSMLAVERTLLELFFFKLFGMGRKHAIIIVLFIFIFCTCARIPTILMRIIVPDPNAKNEHHPSFICTSPADTHLNSKIEMIFVWLNSGGTCFLHFLSNVLVIISIARRKIYLSRSELTWWCAFYTQLSQHLEYFIPPTVILCSQLAPILYFEIGTRYALCLEPKPDKYAHIHLLVSFVNYIPATVTFLIFIYPSKSYMKEFYSNTSVGKWIWKVKESYKHQTVQSTKL